MISTVLGKLLLLRILFGGGNGGGGRGYAPTMPNPSPGDMNRPEPWPQAVPSDLPPFPGPGWEYDTPPPADVVARAWQLVQPLWSQGEGAHQTEQTGGRWITYRAEVMANNVKGVTAWRVKAGAQATSPSSIPATTQTSAPQASPAYVPPASQRPASSPATYSPPPVTSPAPSGGFTPLYVPPAGGMTTAQIQNALNANGANPPLTVDGKYGPATAAAVRAFQASHGLTVDGKAGPLTQAALRGSTSPATSPAAVPAVMRTSTPATAPSGGGFVPFYNPPAGGMSTAQIQSALNAAGAAPPLTADGKYGDLTRAAVVMFQSSHGLTADGKAGPLTQQALRGATASSPPAAVPASLQVPTSMTPATTSDVTLTSAQIQSALNAAGAMPPLVVDGQLGAKSKAAIKLFQSQQGLASDGIAGPLTQAKLRPYLAGMT